MKEFQVAAYPVGVYLSTLFLCCSFLNIFVFLFFVLHQFYFIFSATVEMFFVAYPKRTTFKLYLKEVANRATHELRHEMQVMYEESIDHGEYNKELIEHLDCTKSLSLSALADQLLRSNRKKYEQQLKDFEVEQQQGGNSGGGGGGDSGGS